MAGILRPVTVVAAGDVMSLVLMLVLVRCEVGDKGGKRFALFFAPVLKRGLPVNSENSRDLEVDAGGMQELAHTAANAVPGFVNAEGHRRGAGEVVAKDALGFGQP